MTTKFEVGPLLLMGDAWERHLRDNGEDDNTEFAPESPVDPVADPPTPSASVAEDQTFSRSEHVRANVTDDGLVILDIDKGEIFSANVMAGRVWNLLMDRKSVKEIIEQMTTETDPPQEEMAAQVKKFIDSLVQKNLIQ